jgi:hypothetical protein
VESTFAAIKATLSPVLRAKDSVAQTNEILLRVFVHNLTVLHKMKKQHGLDIDPRPLSERNIQNTSLMPTASQPYEVPDSSAIPILAKTEEAGVRMPKFQVSQEQRKCDECGSIHTRKNNHGYELWYHYKHGSEWYCHQCFFRKEMRDRKNISASNYRRI